MDTNSNTLTTSISRTIAEESKEPITINSLDVKLAEQHNLDTFITTTRLMTVEKENEKLRKSLDDDKLDSLLMKEQYVKKIKKLNTELLNIEIQYQDSHHKNEKALTSVKKTLETSRRALTEETLLHKESRIALNAEKCQVRQNEQQIEHYYQKIKQLEEILENMKSANELRDTQYEMPQMMYYPHSMIGMYPPQFSPQFPNRIYESPQMDLDYKFTEPYYKRKAIDEPEFQEHPSKHNAIGGDLRAIISSRPLYIKERNKRLCYFGKKCDHQICDFAHSLTELVVCRNGIRCNAKSLCGYMIHSEDERTHMSSIVESHGINIVLCKEYHKLNTCINGEQCNKIHYNSH